MERRAIDRLWFVYDADSGKLGAFVDSIKKVLMIQGCALCSITHGLTGERREWKDCKETLGVPVDYVHRDELSPRMREVARELPCVVAESQGELILLLAPEVLARCKGSVADLKGRLLHYAAAKGLDVSFARTPGPATRP